VKTKPKDSHEYHLRLGWEGNRGEGTSNYGGYGRNYRIRVAGKPDLLGSADPAFRGDAGAHNPEDLLLGALSACHMLSYLALCARRGVVVLDYRDEARGVMALTATGGGHFTSVTLHPRVTIGDPAQEDLALELHGQAGRDCFIAASCNFPVGHVPEVIIQGPASDSQ